MIEIKVGNRYTHNYWVYADADRTPMTVQVTRIAKGLVYYRAVKRYCIGTPNEREDPKLGSPMHVALEQAEKNWKEIGQ